MGGLPPLRLVKQGYWQTTAAEGAPTCPAMPHNQFWRASKVPADLAEHAHIFFFSEDVVGANRTAAHEGS